MIGKKDSDTAYIGKRIKHIRKKLNLSQIEFAKILNTSQVNLSKIENENRYSEYTIKAFEYFVKQGINIEWIILEDNIGLSEIKDIDII